MEVTSVKKMTPKDVEQIYLEHLNAAGMMKLVLNLSESSGLDLIDQVGGKRYLDFFGFYASSALGMNHPKMVDDADFRARLSDAALNKITNSDVRTAHMARFLSTFYRIAMPEAFRYAFFVSGGALAVENALKAAFDWKVRKNFAKGYDREVGHQVLHFTEAFHGRSGYTMSLTNTADPRKIKHYPRFDWPRVENPKMVFPEAEHMNDIVARETRALEDVKRHFHERRDDIACVILEPIQGEGGDNHFRPEFLSALSDITHENDALLIFDEVQTGVGSTGSFWVYEALGVTPDLLTFGKKTQVCGMMAGPRLDEVENHVFQEGSRINSTWGGNIVDMVRFDRILEIIEEDDLVGNASTVGAHLLGRIRELESTSDDVTNSRGRGLFCALDLPNTPMRDAVLKACYDEGLIMLGCGRQSIRFRSPLTTTASQVDDAMDILSGCIRSVEKHGA